MKKKYYKQIIRILDTKLEDEIQKNKRLNTRIADLEASNKILRQDLAEKSTEVLKKQYEIDFLKKKDESNTN